MSGAGYELFQTDDIDASAAAHEVSMNEEASCNDGNGEIAGQLSVLDRFLTLWMGSSSSSLKNWSLWSF
ncbi:hypothetical protein BBJ28_00025445 [Nothophytophthora sp. Chile5]|nr:hypothetical protein BBJ28_00025445 [Nothophytophthora sp. Chile5]